MQPKTQQKQQHQNNVQLSKKLSWLLRHGAQKEGLEMQADGFINVSDILTHPRYRECFTLANLRELVASDAKQRYTLRWNESRQTHEIRANQGHSLAVVEAEACLENITSSSQVPLAVHGTYYANWESIKTQGLRRMQRQQVHFAASDVFSGAVSGFRGNAEILIYLNVNRVLADQLPLFRSSNQVILCPGLGPQGIIPTKYFKRVVDRKTGQELTF